MDNLAVIAPHKEKYYNRYDINWLIDAVASGKKLKFVTFWKAEDGEENRCFSQWYCGRPIRINGRSYVTAEQYMMSEKALLFKDYKMYDAIMREPDPKKCKALGKNVSGFDQAVWDSSFREIIWHGNLGKLQSDIEIVDALLSTGDAVLVEAIPIRIASLAHPRILIWIFQKLFECLINRLFIRPNQLQSPCRDSFRPLCRITHYQYRFSQRRCFFLNPS